MDKYELVLAIADNGRWEEFHLKQGNFFMYDHHKGVRLKLEREYRKRFADDEKRRDLEEYRRDAGEEQLP